MLIRVAIREDLSELLRMRALLFPECTAEENRRELEPQFAPPVLLFVAERDDGGLAGFMECNLRKFADGCSGSPVPYVEGWFVDQDMRRKGVGGELMAALEIWARQNGFTELASDCLIDNELSKSAHMSLGFEEVERRIQFRKSLSD